jgi:hypothetical protein
MNPIEAGRLVLESFRMAARACLGPELAKVLDGGLALIDEGLGKRTAERTRTARRRAPAKPKPAPASIDCPMDTRTLSLFSSDQINREKEKRESAARAVAPPPPDPEPPPLRPDAELRAELRAVAEQAGVRDPAACWRKFALLRAGAPWAKVEALWRVWVSYERDKGPPARAAPTAGARASPRPIAKAPVPLEPLVRAPFSLVGLLGPQREACA